MIPCNLVSKVMSGPEILLKRIIGLAEHVWEDHRKELVGIVSVVVAFKAYNCYKKRQRRKKWNNVGNDVIVLHGFPRGRNLPNLSPYVMKLETFIRMAGLKYEFDSEEPRGPKTKSPWITINGQEMGDSQLIVEFLSKKFNLDFNKHLNQEQRGVAKAMTIMTDEHLVWGIPLWRMVQDPDYSALYAMKDPPLYIQYLMKTGAGRSMMISRAKAQGVGHHTDEEIFNIMTEDLKAISLFLGDKAYLMGDELCEADCAVFGMLCQIVWGVPGSPYAASVQSDYRNLMHYCIRMKEKFYPDWDRL